MQFDFINWWTVITYQRP